LHYPYPPHPDTHPPITIGRNGKVWAAAISLFVLMPFSLGVAAADAPPPPCPDSTALTNLTVVPSPPTPYGTPQSIEVLVSALAKQSMQFPGKPIPSPPFRGPTPEGNITSPSGFASDVVLSGLYSFITQRAKKEAEAYLVDELNQQLCGNSQRSPYFPNTCRALKLLDTDGAGVSATGLTTLQRPLEQDFRYLPACLIKRPPDETSGTNAGYLVFDAFRQLTGGGKVDTGSVIYGLTSDHNFADECRVAGSGDLKSRYCLGFEIMTVVSAAMELDNAKNVVPPADRTRAFLALYLFDLSAAYCPAGTKPSAADDIVAQCGGYAKTVYDALADDSSHKIVLDKWEHAISVILQSIVDVGNATKQLKMASDQLDKSPKSTDYQIQAADVLVTLAESLATAARNAMCLRATAPKDCGGTSANFDPDLKQYALMVSDALKGYSLISAHRYVEATAVVSELLGNSSGAITHDELLVVAQVAESKTSDDVQQVLEEIASPVGAWKSKKTSAYLATSSFVGVQAGRETLQNPATKTASGPFYGAYVPLGIEYSWPYTNRKGYFGVYVQALDLGILASDHTSRSQASGDSKTGITQVLSPGIAAFTNPGWLGPVTLGLGYVFRTPALRTTTSSSGAQIQLDSHRIMLSIGIDVTLFRMSH
jgi:hypothetical protein